MADAASWASVAVTLALGVAGFRVAGSINKDVRLRFAEKRMSAYERLWDLMEPANPSAGPLPAASRRQLEQKLADWYYVSGGGMTLTPTARVMYQVVRRNLICPLEELIPPTSRQRLQLLDADLDAERGLLAQRQLSLLRTQMMIDLKIFGKSSGLMLTAEDRDFLGWCGIRTGPWGKVRQ